MNRFEVLWVGHIWVLALLSAALGFQVAEAQLMPPVLQPKTYRSPAGQYALTVDPSDLYGCGEGAYRFSDGGKESWSLTLPFTLWDASVTNRGTIAGYAYTHSAGGFRDFIVV